MSTDRGTPSTDVPEAPAGNTLRSRRAVIGVVAAVLTTAVVVALVVIFAGSGPGESPTGPATANASIRTSTTSPSTSTATSPTPTTTTTATSSQPSALVQLKAFFAAAATMDEQLHRAAAAINAGGPPWTTWSETQASVVGKADIEAVAPTIPAGMPRNLKQAVLLVFSDLTNRRATLGTFARVRGPQQVIEHEGEAYLMQQLANGARAAARYDGDVAAARALASSLPSFTVPAASSRAALEMLVLTRLEIHSRMCCGQTGGTNVTTTLPQIQWKDSTSGIIVTTSAGQPPVREGFTVRKEPDGHFEVSFGSGG